MVLNLHIPEGEKTEFTLKQVINLDNSDHLIATRLGAKPMTLWLQVQHPDATKPERKKDT